MTDDSFLYRIREQPPATFLADLKIRLDRQLRTSMPRWKLGRTLIVGALIGGAAFAFTLMATREPQSPQKPQALAPAPVRSAPVVDPHDRTPSATTSAPPAISAP